MNNHPNKRLPGNLSNLEIGVSSWLWSDHDLIAGMGILKKYGIRNIEISLVPGVFERIDKKLLLKLKKCVAGKFNIVQTHPSGDKYDLSKDRKIDSKKPIEHLKHWVMDFVEYNRPVLVLHASEVFPLKEDRRSRLEICKKNLFELVNFCEKCGTKIAVETMWNMSEQTEKESILGETEEEFLGIVDSVKSKYLGIHIDTGHSYLLGNLMKMVQLAGDRLFALHVHDNHGRRKDLPWDEHLIPGEGDIDWQKFISTLNSVHYKGVFMLELPPKGDLEDRLENMRHWLARLSSK